MCATLAIFWAPFPSLFCLWGSEQVYKFLPFFLIFKLNFDIKDWYAIDLQLFSVQKTIMDNFILLNLSFIKFNIK